MLIYLAIAAALSAVTLICAHCAGGEVGRYARGFKRLAKDKRVPWPARALLICAVLPIPGPVDEIAGLFAVVYLLHTHRSLLTEALQEG